MEDNDGFRVERIKLDWLITNVYVLEGKGGVDVVGFNVYSDTDGIMLVRGGE